MTDAYLDVADELEYKPVPFVVKGQAEWLAYERRVNKYISTLLRRHDGIAYNKLYDVVTPICSRGEDNKYDILIAKPKDDKSKRSVLKIKPFQSTQFKFAMSLEADFLENIVGQHENIIRMDDAYITSSQTVVLVLEHCDLCLERELQRCRGIANRTYTSVISVLGLDVLQGILEQLMNALAYLHAKNVIHGDVKPGNVLLNYSDCCGFKVKLSDFEVSRIKPSSSDLRYKRSEIGADGYKAPEILCGMGVCMKSDVWAAGILAIMCTLAYSPLISEGSYWQQLDNINIFAGPLPMDYLEAFENIEMQETLENKNTKFYRSPIGLFSAFPSVPREMRPLLSNMLHPHRESRISSRTALYDSFFDGDIKQK